MTTTENANVTHGRRAIVVDDSRAARSILRRTLLSLGLEVVEAGDGAEALDKLRAEPPVDLALVDWNMPVMDGLQFVKALRAERAYADIVVLMVSAESDPSRMARALIVGADDFLMKPMTPDVLVGKLEMLDTWRHGIGQTAAAGRSEP
jgi:two-component system chemotaxis response regulator CheY